jgi:hypothetical protein
MSEGQWAAVDALTTVPGELGHRVEGAARPDHASVAAVQDSRGHCACACTMRAGFGHLAKDMEKNSEDWSHWCMSESLHQARLPGDWARLTEFKQLLLLRALRPDRVAASLQCFCEAVMGSRYVNQEAFSPQAVVEESSRWAWLEVGVARQANSVPPLHAHRLMACSRVHHLLPCPCAAPRPSSSSCSRATPRQGTSRSTRASWARPWRTASSSSSPWARARRRPPRQCWTGASPRAAGCSWTTCT